MLLLLLEAVSQHCVLGIFISSLQASQAGYRHRMREQPGFSQLHYRPVCNVSLVSPARREGGLTLTGMPSSDL